VLVMLIVQHYLVCSLELLLPASEANALSVLWMTIAQSFSTDLGQSRFAVLAAVWNAPAAGRVR
jgi:hypothetical protein